MLRFRHNCVCIVGTILVCISGQAQYKGDHIPGFLGLQSGTQAPPGLYVGNLVWVYPTSTVTDNSGRDINFPGRLASTADIILVNVTTNYKMFGGNFGGSIAFPFIKNRIQFNSLNVTSGLAYSDMFGGLSLGWTLKRADVIAGYNLYIPTGTFSVGASDNTGLGMWGNEVFAGSTVYFDSKKTWNLAAVFSAEFHTEKSGTNIKVGDLGTIEGGVGKTFYKKVSGPIPMVTSIGAAGYAQFKMTGDSGSDIPPILRGLRDRVLAVGPEFNIFFPAPRLTFLVRYEPEFGARNRTQGQTILLSLVWVAQSFVKQPSPCAESLMYKATMSIVLLVTWISVCAGSYTNAQIQKPNVVYFLVDNLGMGELSSFSGGPFRGVTTARIDAFGQEGMMLLNFAPEAQCTPSRSALMTGRYSIRSGNQTVALAGSHGGLVKWERTLGDIFSEAGYATAIVGKWHIGDSPGRWPTDHGFDEWYGIPRSYDEALWPEDPWYNPQRDPVTRVVEGRKGQPVRELQQLTLQVRRDIDLEYMRRANDFLERSKKNGKPFFLYFDHSMMHLPVIPRAEFKGKTGSGDWADSLLELDTDFGTLLDYLKQLGLAENTIVVFSGDNGPEEAEPWRGTAGYFEGSYFTGMEGSLRTPAIVRYPGHVPTGQKSNEIVHITDMFTTLVLWAGLQVPKDRVIDGIDQRSFFEGKQTHSNRDGFPFWNGSELYGVKWRNFKLVMVEQKTLTDPALQLPNPHLINLDTDPKEREPLDYPYLHTWVGAHVARILEDYQESIRRESLIPVGAPLDYVPKVQNP